MKCVLFNTNILQLEKSKVPEKATHAVMWYLGLMMGCLSAVLLRFEFLQLIGLEPSPSQLPPLDHPCQVERSALAGQQAGGAADRRQRGQVEVVPGSCASQTGPQSGPTIEAGQVREGGDDQIHRCLEESSAQLGPGEAGRVRDERLQGTHKVGICHRELQTAGLSFLLCIWHDHESLRLLPSLLNSKAKPRAKGRTRRVTWCSD